LGYPIPPWRRRCRPAFAVFLPSPSAEHLRIRLILSCASLLLQSLSSHRRPGADVRAPSMGFHPSSRCHRPESTGQGFPSPHRSVLDVSHVLDGFLLQPTSRVCFAPQPRPGFALQGFPLVRSVMSSSPTTALLPLPELSTPSFTQVLRELASVFRALLRSPVRRRTQLFRPRPAPSPPELHPPSGFPSHTVERPSSPLRPRPFTAPVVLPVRDLTCSCEPIFPVRGSRPATPCRLAPSLRHEAADCLYANPFGRNLHSTSDTIACKAEIALSVEFKRNDFTDYCCSIPMLTWR
jgi:hypothetical protein